MRRMSFGQAVEKMREKIYKGEQDQEYYDVVDTILYLWDQDYATRHNKAILPTPLFKQSSPGELYLLMRINPLRYLLVKRDKTVRMITYG